MGVQKSDFVEHEEVAECGRSRLQLLLHLQTDIRQLRFLCEC
jgi:hypothetical protein